MTGDVRGRRPTIEQVAQRAGVARGTVSRVLNGSTEVAAATREAVLAAIDELGYVPNEAARTLVTRRTDAIALVVAESEERLFAEPFFGAIVRGISRALAHASRRLLLTFADSSSELDLLGPYLTGQHVDGVLLLSLHADTTLPLRLEAAGVPFVTGGRPIGRRPAHVVDIDNLSGATSAVQHLLDRGRRRIASITGPMDHDAGRRRQEGYRGALERARIPYDPTLVVEGDYSAASGRAAMASLLARRPDVDAVFAASDPSALAAMAVLQEQGRYVPDDVAVVGYDDSAGAALAHPALTSVHQPVAEMGRAMVDVLLTALEGRPAPAEVLLPATLVVRDSS